MAPEEFEYAKKMIGTNLSNFSAWHYRTKLIQRLLNEKSASDEERKKMLDDGKPVVAWNYNLIMLTMVQNWNSFIVLYVTHTTNLSGFTIRT